MKPKENKEININSLAEKKKVISLAKRKRNGLKTQQVVYLFKTGQKNGKTLYHSRTVHELVK